MDTTDGGSNVKKWVELFNGRHERVPWIHHATHSIQLCINTAHGKGKTESPKSASALFKRATETKRNSRLALGVSVHKLAAEIRNAVEVVSRSLVKINADKA
ncbi:hypothetical protein BG015_000786 [Linnemannia schmuckeri]|uniref:Uncharacterized protein n=1 Tax=Linnemannia schmuckeri TaxID=64567 RepID=A0A9P5S7G3_9FUNG|nr:hypothetical protein BG015_000786 [Linnemannia schmuckeri]